MIGFRVGGDFFMAEKKDEITLPEEEFVQLFVRSSLVTPLDKPTLVCKVWTKKSYNPNSF